LELAGGSVSALLFYYYGFTIAFASIFLFCCFFFMNYVVEFRYGLLAPQLYFPALAVGLALSFLPGDPSFPGALAGGLVGGGVLVLTKAFRREESAAEKAAQRQLALISLIGVFLGWPSALFVLSAAAAAAWALPLVAHRLFKREAEDVFSLAVMASALVTAFFHADLAQWYFRVR
jgi:leader peptidase (prepilin peptidase)/N-methyltransferase